MILQINCFSVLFVLEIFIYMLRTSLVAQLVKNPPAVPETWVPSLGQEDPLKKGKCSGLENPMDTGA